MSTNVYVLDVDGVGEGFKRVVVEALYGGEQSQVIRHAAGKCFRQSEIVNGERHVVAEHAECFEFVFAVGGIAFAAAQR